MKRILKLRATSHTAVEKARMHIKKMPNIVPKKVAQTMRVDLKNISWMLDPIQSYLTNIKKQKLPVFAEALSRNMTGIYFQFLDYKVSAKENITLEWKGQPRSGKSTGAISTHKYIGKRTGVIFKVDNICPNEQYYLDAVKYAIDNQGLIVDEQQEQQTGLGAFRAMQHTEDLANIIAKRCLTGDTLIEMGDGSFKKIINIVNTHQKVMSVDIERRIKEVMPAVVFSTGVDDVYEVTTESGRILRCTSDHELFIVNKRKIFKKALRNIKIGDELVTIE